MTEPHTEAAPPGDVGAPVDATALEPPADPRLAHVLTRLDELEGTEPAEHVAVYEAVHRTLQEVLADAADGTSDPGVAEA
jgi:hypothetical protein